MSNVLVQESSLSAIAVAIREKNGTANTYKPAQMAPAIENIPTGITPTGTMEITENGVYNVTNYASADVDVEGLVPTGTLSINENGTYDVTEYAGASVNVPGLVPTGTLNISENGTYDVTSYANVDVDIEPESIEVPVYYYDLDTGYVNSGTWIIGGSTVSYSDVYEVEAGKTYLIMLGSTVGTRFRTVFTTTDTSTATSNVSGTNVTNVTSPNPHQSQIYVANTSGYLTITKDNAGTSGLKTYVLDITDFL